ncbi:MAG: alanine racemase [Desulfococcaceae bacterium]
MPREAALAQARIDLGAIDHNLRELRRVTRPTARIMAVVKADGYGHGATPTARTALAAGADALAVARLPEGRRLRRDGIDAPILVLGPTPAERAVELVADDLTATVTGLESARALSDAARSAGARLKVHVKVDTGMGRLGILAFPRPDQSQAAAEAIAEIDRLVGLELQGVFTHFAAADATDLSFARLQLDRFNDLLERLRGLGVEVPLRHAANSGGVISLADAHFDLVRPGISLYGLYPSNEVDREKIRLRPAMTLQTEVLHVKRVPADFPVSYGMTYRTPAPTTLATVAVGYADGLDRLLSSRGHMLVHGRRAPIVGRVCMDLTILDVGAIPDVGVGDPVTVFGGEEPGAVSADEIADLAGTINYEVVSTIAPRVTRVYADVMP